jgi:hypothetical protein
VAALAAALAVNAAAESAVDAVAISDAASAVAGRARADHAKK